MSERYDEALDELRQLTGECRSQSEMVSYGHFYGGDPRKFSPDPECSTDAERDAHAAACRLWDAGDRDPLPGPHEPLTNDAGDVIGHITRSGFGLGTNICEDEAMLDISERLERILNRLENP